MKRLLIVDDDERLRSLVRTYGELELFTCAEAADGLTALDMIQQEPYDLMILDVMMPGLDGFETLERIRKISQVPVIMLTARSEEYDKLLGFKLGVDDYVSKPFSPKELMARAAAILKRSGAREIQTLTFGDLSISPDSHQAALNGTPLNLAPKEFDLLFKLASHPRMVFSREQLLQEVWGYSYYGDGRTVDTHVKALREHLGSYRSLIQTVWGVGYKFEYRKDEE